MAATVHGAVREGREASVADVDWGPGRATLKVTGTTSAAEACSAAVTWWDGYSTSGIWKAKTFRARCVNADGGVFEVEVELRPAGDELLDPNSPYYRGFESSVQEIQSERDINGLTITVSHTFPETDPDWPGQTKEQGGQANVKLPTTVYTRNKVVYTHYPEVYQVIQGAVNAEQWMGHPSGYVRCTSVRPVKCWRRDGDVTPPKWLLQFTFEMSTWGWTDYAVYIDPRDGRPPVNAAYGYGIKPVATHEWYDFNLLFDTSEMPDWSEIIRAELPLGTLG